MPLMTDLTSYAEPENPALPISDFVLDREHAALVITDPQIDFLSPEGANLCVEGHLRELIEQGFEVAVVKDATAGPRLPEGDPYLAAHWTTAEAVALLKEKPRNASPNIFSGLAT
jgi:nicotinamidase-related amidase